MPQTQKMKVEKARALASLVPSTWDEEKRTIDVIVATGAAVRRYEWWSGEYYDEELEISDSAIRMGRLNSGAAVLNAHAQWDLGDQIGVVERAWIDDGKLMATLRLSAREDVAGIVQDIKDGIIRNISVGYIPHVYEKIEVAGQIPVKRAIDWEPTEVSFVPVPADPGAQSRSASQPQLYEVRVITRDNPTAAPSAPASAGASPLGATQQEDTRTMDEQQQNRGGAQQAPAPAVDTEAIRAEATRAERHRVSEIRTLARMANLDDAFANDLIERGVSLDEAREQIKAKWAEQANARTVSINVSVTRDEGDTFRHGVRAALMLRGGAKDKIKPEEIEMAREYRGMSLIDIGREAIERAGGSTRGLSKMEIATVALGLRALPGMHSTSDFPEILGNVANSYLRDGYESAPQTFRPLTRERNATDFKPITALQFGDAPKLLKVGEGEEYKYGTIGEGKEVYALETFGRIVAITRQAIVNDNHDAFTRLPQMYGRSAADLESEVVWGLFTANAGLGQTMGDGKTLFHTDHGNIGTGGAITVDTLGEARKLMRLQKSLDGNLINVMPRYLIVPASLETVAQKYLASAQIVYAKSSDYNPFAGSLTQITEPRLDAVSDKAWFVAADPGQIDMIEIAYLDGERLRIDQRVGFEVDGLEVKASMDFGARILDYRGFVRNAGQ